MRPYHWLYHWLYWLCTWQDMSASSAGRESRAQLTLLLFVRWCSDKNMIIATKDDIVHLHFYQTKTDQVEFGNKILLDTLQMIQKTGWNIFLWLKWFPDIVKHIFSDAWIKWPSITKILASDPLLCLKEPPMTLKNHGYLDTKREHICSALVCDFFYHGRHHYM